MRRAIVSKSCKGLPLKGILSATQVSAGVKFDNQVLDFSPDKQRIGWLPFRFPPNVFLSCPSLVGQVLAQSISYRTSCGFADICYISQSPL